MLTLLLFLGVQASGVPDGVLRSDAKLQVTDDGECLRFQPRGAAPAATLVFLRYGASDGVCAGAPWHREPGLLPTHWF